ncbi:hypothetical protein AXF42_Ash016740 [Apostasia shenzhenica]|uniref:Uncharacterized protein n=1 Tax=Apostasia shenzhenica TaxID=1088818 RepID=A0A2I0AQ81_9ASPA|nr:hypothetical protein AXF42_Ash016740 [Apostasia shenzhenica]
MEYYSTRRLLTLAVAAVVVCGTGQMTTTTAEGEWMELGRPTADIIARLAADVYNHLQHRQLTYLWALGAVVCYGNAEQNGFVYDIKFSAYLDLYGIPVDGRWVKIMTTLVIAHMRILVPYDISHRRASILGKPDFVYGGGLPFNKNRHN